MNRKRILKISLILITLWSLSSGSVFAKGQKLCDPGFEQSTPNGLFPDSKGWKRADAGGGADAGCVANGVANHCGTNGLWNYTGNETWAYWSAPYQEFASGAGWVYNASAWIRQPDRNPYPPYDHGWVPGSEAFVRVEFLDSTKRVISYVDSSPKIITDDATWTLSSITNATAPRDTAYVRFTCRIEKPNGSAGVSIACFDCCFFELTKTPLDYSFNIYSDQGAAGFIGVYGSSFTLATDKETYQEGTESMKATYKIVGGGWGGWYCEEGGPGGSERKNMMEYEVGYLKFCVKTEVDLIIGIRSINIPAGFEKSKVKVSDYGACLHGEWREVYIPLRDFKAKEPRLDFRRIIVYFTAAVVNEKGEAISGSFWIDNVKWLTQRPPVPNNPTNLSATSISTNQINLSWQDNSDNELGFKIERKKEGGEYVQVAVMISDKTNYSDTDLLPNTVYTYRVRAYNNGGDSDYSNEVSAKTLKEPEMTNEGKAYSHLYKVMDKYHKSLDVYTDRDAGGNCFYPSHWYNGGNNMSLDTNCIENPYSGWSCIKVTWNGGAGIDGWLWNGIMFNVWPTWKDKKENPGYKEYNLTGATKLTFWARTDEPGLKLKFLVGYPDDSSGEVLINEDGWMELYTTWTKYEIDLSGKDLRNIRGGFAFVFNEREDPDPNGCTFYLDEIKFDKERLNELRFLLSYEAIPSKEEDKAMRNPAWIYDNALAMLAFMARGSDEDWRRAKILADSFVYAQNNDRYFNDGRLRNAYQSGNLADLQTGKARIPGWWDDAQQKWVEFGYDTHIGNLAWVMISLLRYYEVKGGSEYLKTAENLGKWIYENCYDTRGAGGYTGGYEGWDRNQKKINWKSTEHNIDVYVAFVKLDEITNDSIWKNRAIHAKNFVKAMWNESGGHFWTGTEDDGESINKHPIPTDAQAWGVAALGEIYKAGISWAENNCYKECCGFKGLDFSNSNLDGIQWEVTASMAVAFQIIKEENKSDNFLNELRRAQANGPNGRGVVAACHDGVDTGYNWKYYYRLYIGSTAWFIFAERKHNPYWQISTDSPISRPIAYIDSISPSPAVYGTPVNFVGHGIDRDGTIVAYLWRSSIDGTLSDQASFTKTDLSLGTHTIYFKVCDDDNKWSEEVTRILRIIIRPNAPTGLTATLGDKMIKLEWKDNSDNEDGFEISRSKDNENWKIIATTAPNTCIYIDKDPEIIWNPPTKYFYRIRAYNEAGYSDYSKTEIITCILVWPNPFIPSKGHTKITFKGSGVIYATIKIYNIAGELVKTMEETQGIDTITWDATNDEGSPLASGIYIWISENQMERNKGKIAIIK